MLGRRVVAFPGCCSCSSSRSSSESAPRGRFSPSGSPEPRASPAAPHPCGRVSARDFVAAARSPVSVGSASCCATCCPTSPSRWSSTSTIGAGAALLAFAGLSFLGLGVQQPSLRLGPAVSDGVGDLRPSGGSTRARGVAVILAGLAFNLSARPSRGASASGEPGSRRWARDRPRRSRPRPTKGGRRSPDGRTVRRRARRTRTSRRRFPGASGPIRPVRGVAFRVRRGQTVGLVGESGSGKSVTALAVSQLVGDTGRVDADRLSFVGTDLLDGKPDQTLLGQSLAVVFQDPMTTFNPAHDRARSPRSPASIRVWDVVPPSPVPSTASAP